MTTREETNRPVNARGLAVLSGLLVLLLAAWNVRSVVDFEFLAWDDDINITLNPHLGPPVGANLGWMLTDTAYMRRYVPLGWLGFSAVYAQVGLTPTGYHATNVALHGINSLLLFVVLLRLLRRWGAAAEDRWRVLCALLGALGWALHPFRAESVGWASGLLYGLAGFFALAALCVYLGERGSRGVRTWLAAILFVASLLTYPVAIGLVVVFIALDVERWMRTRDGTTPWEKDPALWRVLREKIPFVVVAVGVAVVNLEARYEPSAFWPGAPTLVELTAFDRSMRGIYTFVYYLWKSAWPSHLTPAPTPLLEFSGGEWRAWLSLAALAGLTWAAWRRRGVRLLWICYLGLMLPLIGLTEQQYFPCDRYAYLAGMTFSVAVAVALTWLQPGRLREWIGLLAIVTLAILLIVQRLALPVWQDTDAVFTRIARETEDDNFRARTFLRWALYHAQRGDADEAKNILLRATEAGVGPARVFAMLDEVAEHAQSGAVAVSKLHEKLAREASVAGRLPEAHEHFKLALGLAPASTATSTRLNYAVFCALAGDPDLALHLYLRATATPDTALPAQRAQVLRVIAQAFHLARQSRLAWLTMERAVREAPADQVEPAAREELERYRRAALKPSLG
jgi:tetratricopeptide (TPR) repeat protein